MTIINFKLPPLVAFAFVLGVAAIAGTLIFVVSEQPMAEPSGGVVATRAPAADESAELSQEPEPQDETENWKAYAGDGWQVKYPNTFYIDGIGGGVAVLPIGTIDSVFTFSDIPYSHLLDICAGSYNGCLTNIPKTVLDSRGVFVGADNTSATRVRYINEHDREVTSVFIETRTKDGVILLTHYDLSRDAGVYDQILSTFRFLE